jgi:hypothetical protein
MALNKTEDAKSLQIYFLAGSCPQALTNATIKKEHQKHERQT